MDQAPSISHAGSRHIPSEPEKKRRHLWVWVVVLAAFGLLFYWVLHQHSQGQKQAGAAAAGGRRGPAGMMGGPVPVTTATATLGNLPVYVDSIGTVTPVYTDTITPEVNGIITGVYYHEGQYVKKGDPLVDIDPRPYAAQLAQAQGALERDQSMLAEARMDLARYQKAWSKNAIPRQTLEDQEKLVMVDEGTVKNDQGTVQYDQVQVSFCHITSPITGRVGLRLIDPGNVVTANSTTPLVVVTQMQPITVIFTLPEDSLPEVLEQMHRGRTLEVDAYDRTQQHLLAKGRLITVDNQIDTTTGTVKLRAEFPNAEGMLFPNQFVNTELLVKTLKNQLLLPSSAVQHNGAVSFVYLLEGNKAHMRTVRAGAAEGGNTVVAGLNPGDVVADSSFEKLQDGSTIFRSKLALPSSSGGAIGSVAP